MTSVCTGALLLGAAGLLDGYAATTHWAFVDLLPQFGARPAPGRVVVDRNRITAGGVTAGLDFGLRLVTELAGERQARMIQLGLEYDPEPPFRSGHPSVADPDLVAEVRAQLAGDGRGARRGGPEGGLRRRPGAVSSRPPARARWIAVRGAGAAFAAHHASSAVHGGSRPIYRRFGGVSEAARPSARAGTPRAATACPCRSPLLCSAARPAARPAPGRRAPHQASPPSPPSRSSPRRALRLLDLHALDREAAGQRARRLLVSAAPASAGSPASSSSTSPTPTASASRCPGSTGSSRSAGRAR